jgi:hypothetical protein
LCEFILVKLEALFLPYDTALMLFTVLNSVMDAQRSLAIKSSTDDNIYAGRRSMSEMVDLLTDRIKADTVAGQDSISRVCSSMRLAVIADESYQYGVSVTSSRNSMEESFASAAVTSVSLSSSVTDEGEGAGAGAVTLALYELPPPYISDSQRALSNTIKVVASVPSTRSAESRDVTVVVQSFQPQLYSYITNSTKNTTVFTICEQGSFINRSHTCFSGEKVIHKCNGTRAKIITRCRVHRPTCGVLVAGIVRESKMCRMLTFTNTTTTCTCNLDFGSSRRRLATADDIVEETGYIELCAMTTTVGKDFAETLLTSEDITAQDVEGSVSILVMYASLW